MKKTAKNLSLKHIVQLTIILYLNPNNFARRIIDLSLIHLRRDFPRRRNGQRLTRWSPWNPKKSISAFETEYRLPLDVFRFTCHGQQAAVKLTADESNADSFLVLSFPVARNVIPVRLVIRAVVYKHVGVHSRSNSLSE